MKKRLAAVLLTLCMVIGALPLAALAATYEGTDAQGNKVTITTDDATGKVTKVDGDANTYYQYDDVLTGDTDIFHYYTYEGVEGTLNVTLVKAQTYTVTFNVNAPADLPEGVTAPAAPAEQTVEEGKTATEPAALELEGYKFVGWTTTAPETEAKVLFDFTTAITADTTLYAVWEKVAEATVTVVPNQDGSASATVDEITNEAVEQLKDGDIVNIPATTEEGNATAVDVTISKNNMAQLAKTEMPVDIETDRGTVSLPAADVAKLAEQDGVVLTIGAEQEAPADVAVPEGATASKVVDVSLTNTAGEPIAEEGNTLGLNITVSVKVELTIGTGKQAAVWYKPATGALVAQTGVKYTNGLISWLASHFSEYVFGETTIETPSDVTVQKVTFVDDPQGLAYTVSATANQAIVYDVQGPNGTHSILSTKVGADGSAKVVVSENTEKVAIWVADTITWDATALKYTAEGSIQAFEWEASK